MAFERLEKQLEKIPPRYVGIFMHSTLGISALFQPTLAGGVFSFIDKHIPAVSIPAIGVLFILFAIISALIPDKRLYLASGLLFLVFALMAAYGAFILGEVTFQSGILWLSVALYNLLSYVTGEHNGR